MEIQQELLRKAIQAARSGSYISIDDHPIARPGKAIVLAPHPDDPESSAVFQRMLLRGGWDIRWIILTSAWSSVRDDFAGPGKEAKASVRRTEQTESARLFGIDKESLSFLNLPETPDGELEDTAESYSIIADILSEAHPQIIIIPWGKDTNPTHRLVHQWLEKWLENCFHPVIALFCEDPKSLDFAPHLSVRYDEDTARWKALLLDCHKSQTHRNMVTRGLTFSERIIATNISTSDDGRVCYSERYRLSVHITGDED